MYAWGKNRDIRVFYYSGLNDRQVWGLYNAIKQLTGVNLTSVPYEDDPKILLGYDSIDTYLSKNFRYWDLIKFIHGYGSYHFGDGVNYHNLYLSIAMKAFGIPYSNRGVYYEHYVNGTCRFAAVPEGIIFGLPDYILEPLKQGKYGEVLILPGNGFSCIGSPLYGIKQDLAYGQQHPVQPNLKYIEIYLPTRGDEIYFISGREGDIYFFKEGIKG